MIVKKKEFYGLNIDRVFKSVVIGSKDLKFINLILTDIMEEEVEIEKIEYAEIPVDSIKEKVQILDVLVRTKNGNKINVEVNSNFSRAYKERNLMYYYSLCLKCYRDKERRERKEWEGIKEVIQINLNYEKSGKELKEEIGLINKKTQEVYYNGFKIINVNLEKYKEECYDKNIKGNKEHIYLVTLASNEEELKELGKKDKVVKEVGEKVLEINKDEEIRRQIELERDAKIIIKREKEFAREEGYQEGHEGGLQEGIEKGIQIGREEGIQKVYDIAKELKEKGLSEEEIEEITGLSKEEITNLLEDTEK